LSGVINTLERGLCPQPYKEKSFLTGFTGLREGLRDEILPCPDGRTKSNQLLRSINLHFCRQAMASAWAGFRPVHAYPANPVNPV
jgi:hypothetical protein